MLIVHLLGRVLCLLGFSFRVCHNLENGLFSSVLLGDLFQGNHSCEWTIQFSSFRFVSRCMFYESRIVLKKKKSDLMDMVLQQH